MEWYIVAVLAGAGLIAFLLMGLPISISLGLTGVTLLLILEGPRSLTIVSSLALHFATSWSFICLPLFVFMAEILVFTGIGSEVFEAAHKWVGRLPGGMGIASIISCGLFSAACGSSTATAVAIGVLAVPEMLKRGYKKGLASGSVAAGGTLGILIPPSAVMIIYGIITEQSISELFIAGIIPGIMMVCIFSSYFFVTGLIRPGDAPRAPAGIPWKERLVSLKAVWPVLFIFVFIFATLYAGICTPTEAAGVGAFAALIVALIFKKLSWPNLSSAFRRTLQTVCFVFFIIIGAMIFAFLLTTSMIPHELTTLIGEAELSPLVVLLAINFLLLILGMFMDAAGLLLVTTPILYPIAMGVGCDPIWFGVFMTLCIELGLVTPPVGVNLYVIKGICPPEVTTGDVIRGGIPFAVMLEIGVLLLIFFPWLASWLPSTML